jgi:hypothetical protein
MSSRVYQILVYSKHPIRHHQSGMRKSPIRTPVPSHITIVMLHAYMYAHPARRLIPSFPFQIKLFYINGSHSITGHSTLKTQ